jgi:predicted nucleic acid-binding protein
VKSAVLADTGPLYAAADPDDAHHKRALQELRRLSRERREVMVGYPTLLEAYTLVLFRLGADTSLRWLDDMAGAVLVNPSIEDYRQAVTRVHSLSDQPITLFDAVTASMATRMGIEVWTFDHHFDVMRIPVWR